MGLLLLLSAVLTFGCDNKESTTPDDPDSEAIGTLISQSPAFTRFAALITVADSEIPDGERGILEMLNDTELGEMYSVFAPSDEVFELLRIQWQASSIDEVIDEFTHSGLPSKTRDFVLGHIFIDDTKLQSSAFRADLQLTSSKGIGWKMISSENIQSGFGFVLSNSSASSNPYPIYEMDVLVGSNGIVHSALVN